MTATYGINISITVKGETEHNCDQIAFYYKDVIRTKLHNAFNKGKKQMYQDLLSYEVELPNLQTEPK